ncbi:hypothetical protein GCM10027452_31060 [Micromonospora halotolerans]
MSVTPENLGDLSRRTLLQRAAAAGLLAVPAMGVLSACAGSEPEKSDTGGGAKSKDNPFGVKDGSAVKVVVFNGGLGDQWAKEDKVIFSAKHPNVTVNMSSTQKIKTEEQPKMATQPSDLVMNSGADMMDRSTLINEGAIEPLDDLLTAPAWDSEGTVADSLLPGTVTDGTQNGKFYVVNVAYTVWGNWYNAALFKKEGWQAPTTWEEFFALAPKINLEDRRQAGRRRHRQPEGERLEGRRRGQGAGAVGEAGQGQAAPPGQARPHPVAAGVPRRQGGVHPGRHVAEERDGRHHPAGLRADPVRLLAQRGRQDAEGRVRLVR